MFVPCREAPVLSEHGIYGLCLSLNSPVVHADDLPLGPVRAAIAFHAGSQGAPALTVALRSLDAETTALYQFDGPLDESDGVDRNISIALCFAESLGFLFDDDLVAAHAGDAAPAAASWQELLLDEELPDPLLDLLSEEEQRSASVVAAVVEPGPDPTIALLSKFRRAEACASAGGEWDDRSRPGAGARCESRPVAADPIGRLLACF
jgi:hypothetical protein